MSNLSVMLYGPDPESKSRTGGVAACVRNVRRMLSEKGVRVYAVSYDSPEYLSKYPLRKVLGVIWSVLHVAVAKNSHDIVVHFNTSIFSKAFLRDLPAFLLCKLKRYPIILHVHGGRVSNVRQNFCANWLLQFYLKNSAVVAVFPGVQFREFIELRFSKKIQRVLNPVPITDTACKQSNICRFLFLGRLIPEKGILNTIEAYKIVRSETDRIELIIAGEGSLTAQVRMSANEAGTKGMVYVGFAKGDGLRQIVSASHVYLLPSTYQEGLPVSYLECAEKGLACVVTRNSAIPEIFQEGKEFLAFEDASVKEIAHNMRFLANNVQIRTRLGQAARLAVHRCCSFDAVFRMYSDLYLSVAK